MRDKDKITINFLLVFMILIFFAIISSFGFLNLGKDHFLILVLIILIMYFLILVLFLYPRKNSPKLSKEDLSLIKASVLGPKVKGVFVEPANEEIMKFVGSKKGKTYHLIDCELAKKISSDLRIESVDSNFFKKNKYKLCLNCSKRI